MTHAIPVAMYFNKDFSFVGWQLAVKPPRVARKPPRVFYRSIHGRDLRVYDLPGRMGTSFDLGGGN